MDEIQQLEQLTGSTINEAKASALRPWGDSDSESVDLIDFHRQLSSSKFRQPSGFTAVLYSV